MGESFRTYYPGSTVQLIQINEHIYVERAVCETFATMMSNAWCVSTKLHCPKPGLIPVLFKGICNQLCTDLQPFIKPTAEHPWKLAAPGTRRQ